jgi:hypothetical protein
MLVPVLEPKLILELVTTIHVIHQKCGLLEGVVAKVQLEEKVEEQRDHTRLRVVLPKLIPAGVEKEMLEALMEAQGLY